MDTAELMTALSFACRTMAASLQVSKYGKLFEPTPDGKWSDSVIEKAVKEDNKELKDLIGMMMSIGGMATVAECGEIKFE